LVSPRFCQLVHGFFWVLCCCWHENDDIKLVTLNWWRHLENWSRQLISVYTVVLLFVFLVRKLNKCLNCGFVVVSDLLYVYSKILQIPTEQTVYLTIYAEISLNSTDLMFIHDQTWTWKDRNGSKRPENIADDRTGARQASDSLLLSVLITDRLDP